jgi:predicted ATP-grasp superfamily ATP-dependent carboligase
MTRVLIAGVSTRAAAESAVRAGFQVVTLDAYGDLDQPSECRMLPGGTPWRAAAAARYAGAITADAVAFGSNLDNDPQAVRSLAAGRKLWGNSAASLGRARDPVAVSAAFRLAGLAAPDVVTRWNYVGSFMTGQPGAWLVKPVRSGGGAGVRRWRGPRLPAGCYLQRYVPGRAGSVVFVAARGRAVVLGTSRQIVGDAAFGASAFRYCGNLLLPCDQAGGQAGVIAQTAAASFGLTGVGGVDFIASDGVMHPIEVNPRWTASMELVERACGVPVFGAHVEACTTGALPSVGVFEATHTEVHGKAVVFARNEVTVGDTREWLDDLSVRDIPRPHTRIASGHPVCTVFAQGPDEEACYDALVRRAGSVYGQLARWARTPS